MGEYGIPYMGSKDGIAETLIRVFPPADHFYDLFGGGFSVTHAMLVNRSKSFKHLHYNEIKSDIVELVKDAIAGKYNYDVFKPEFVDRETFFAEKDCNAYMRICWSFGNNQRTYMFHKDIEPYKRSMHNAVVFNSFDDLAEQVFKCKKFQDGYSIKDRRLFLRARIEQYRLNGIPEFLIKYLNEKQLSTLLGDPKGSYQLQQLRSLQQLEKLNFYSMSYDKIEIKPNSVIYCDPPYKGTADYGGGF